MTTEAITPLRQRMIEDMNSRKLGAHSQRSHTTVLTLNFSFKLNYPTDQNSGNQCFSCLSDLRTEAYGLCYFFQYCNSVVLSLGEGA